MGDGRWGMGAVAVDLACLAVDAEGSVVQSGALLLALGTYVRPALALVLFANRFKQ